MLLHITQRLHDMAASTLQRLLKPCLLSLRAHLGGITQIFPHRDVDVGACLNEAFKPGLDQPSLLDRINPFVGDLSFVSLQIVYMHKQLHNTLKKRKTRNRII